MGLIYRIFVLREIPPALVWSSEEDVQHWGQREQLHSIYNGRRGHQQKQGIHMVISLAIDYQEALMLFVCLQACIKRM